MYELVAFDMIWLICSTELKAPFQFPHEWEYQNTVQFFWSYSFCMKHLDQIQHLGDTFFDSFFPESNKTHTPLTVDFQRFHAMDFWRARRAFRKKIHKERRWERLFWLEGYVSTTRCSMVVSKHGCGSDEKWFSAVRDGCHFRWMRFDMSPLVELELFPTDKTWQNRLTG